MKLVGGEEGVFSFPVHGPAILKELAVEIPKQTAALLWNWFWFDILFMLFSTRQLG